MRGLILLGCVLFASACDEVATVEPENATTVRIVNVASPATQSAPFLLRLQNIGIAGSYHAVGYTGYEYFDDDEGKYRWWTDEVCSQIPMAIEANTTINTQIPGCGTNKVKWIVIETAEHGSTTWLHTACFAVGSTSCPEELQRVR
jgi:ABC-type transport system substrate-binding protein